MHHHNRILVIFFILFLTLFKSQALQYDSYKKILGFINSYEENDERAIGYVKMYLSKAKRENDLKRLIKGYEHAIYSTGDVERKLIYADSAIATAIHSKIEDQISRSYMGKGIIYYYNRRQYKQALDLYLTAFKFSKNSKDDYLKNKIVYHLGMVKSYLGYYEEAAAHFEQTAVFFEANALNKLHPNQIIDNESGYYNSIYRLSSCYKNLNLFHKEDSLISMGLNRLQNTNVHPLAYGYFQKGKGVQLLRKGRSKEALPYFTAAEKILDHEQDYASLTIVYYYMGKLFFMENKRTESLFYFNKVDAFVNKFWFVTPEIRSNYEYLINDSKAFDKPEKQLYYTNQLLKTDSIINADFAMLSGKMYRQYDKETLLTDKNKLISELNFNVKILYFAIGIAILILFLLIYRSSKREKKLSGKYQAILEKYRTSANADEIDQLEVQKSPEKDLYSEEVTDKIKLNLKMFEKKKLFLKPNLTIPIVAKMIGTNRTHLSYVLNEQMQISFPIYLKRLRIQYITKQLMEDNRYLNYKMDTLAKECGIVNRQLFSIHFLDINGIRPMDFIRKRKEELEKSSQN